MSNNEDKVNPEVSTSQDTVPDKPKQKRAPRSDRGKPHQKKYAKGDILGRKITARILSQLTAGVPIKQIAETQEVTVQAVQKVHDEFKPVFVELDRVPTYRQARHLLLDAGELSALKSVVMSLDDPSARLHDKAYSYDVIAKQRRLEQGLATSNIAHAIQFVDTPLCDLKKR